MSKLKLFIKNNLFLSISILVLAIVLIIISIVYIPKPKQKINNTIKSETIDIFDELDRKVLESNDGSVKSIKGKSAIYYNSKKIMCPSLEYSLLSNDEIFITFEDDVYKIYKYNMNLKYSNELNCVYINSLNKKPIGITNYTNNYSNTNEEILGNYIIYEDLKYGKIENDTIYNSNASDSIITHYKLKEYKPDFLLGIYQNRKNERIMISNNEIYDMYLYYDYSYFNLITILSKDEKVLKVNGYTLITNKAIYNYGIVDYSCYEYADKECLNGFKKNEDLTARYDDIMFVNDSYVIFENGNAYLYELPEISID